MTLKTHRWEATSPNVEKKYEAVCAECRILRSRKSGQHEPTYREPGGPVYKSAHVPPCDPEPDNDEPFEYQGPF